MVSFIFGYARSYQYVLTVVMPLDGPTDNWCRLYSCPDEGKQEHYIMFRSSVAGTGARLHPERERALGEHRTFSRPFALAQLSPC